MNDELPTLASCRNVTKLDWKQKHRKYLDGYAAAMEANNTMHQDRLKFWESKLESLEFKKGEEDNIEFDLIEARIAENRDILGKK